MGPDSVDPGELTVVGDAEGVMRRSNRKTTISVYDVRPAAAPASGLLKVTTSSLENARYPLHLASQDAPTAWLPVE